MRLCSKYSVFCSWLFFGFVADSDHLSNSFRRHYFPRDSDILREEAYLRKSKRKRARRAGKGDEEAHRNGADMDGDKLPSSALP